MEYDCPANTIVIIAANICALATWCELPALAIPVGGPSASLAAALHWEMAMSSHVPVEVARLREPCLAYFALVWFFTSVSAVVLGEGGAIGKPFVAHITLVRAVARVCAHVGCY